MESVNDDISNLMLINPSVSTAEFAREKRLHS